MSDPNLMEFYSRLARFEKMHRKGYAFDAPGTLSRPRRKSKHSIIKSLIKPLVVVAACGIGLKAAIYHQVGADDYINRVALLEQGQGFDRLGGWLMQVDGATVYFADKIATGVAFFE